MLSADNPFYRQVVLLVELLPLVARESCFALKGGTAINLFIRNLPRLSVDIDLTYLPVQERDRSLAHIDDALRRLGSGIEAAMRGATAVFTGRVGERATKFQVRRGRERVQIEVSPVLRGAVHEPTLRDSSPAVTEQFGLVRMPVLHPLDIYGGKLCAALDRQHPRDLFDVMQLQHVEGIDRALFEVFLVYVLSGDLSRSPGCGRYQNFNAGAACHYRFSGYAPWATNQLRRIYRIARASSLGDSGASALDWTHVGTVSPSI